VIRKKKLKIKKTFFFSFENSKDSTFRYLKNSDDFLGLCCEKRVLKTKRVEPKFKTKIVKKQTNKIVYTVISKAFFLIE